MRSRFIFIAGIFSAVGFIILISGGYRLTSSNRYCMSCHVHVDADNSWILSTHGSNDAGMQVACISCHLPDKKNILNHSYHKARHGFKDLYGFWFKDHEKFDWEARSTAEAAEDFVYVESCQSCHTNLFPADLSDEGSDAHLQYVKGIGNRRCIKCHLHVGHYDPDAHASNPSFGEPEPVDTIYSMPSEPQGFVSFQEQIPGTSVTFKMQAVPGGEYLMGSEPGMPFIQGDELPQRQVKVDSFWMGVTEVSWNEYLAFFNATGSQGRKEALMPEKEDVDGITGPTPPWGAPDQGWGMGERPAITMSHYAATVYCEWLSQMTGKRYRLPTEAEWEYAARAGSQGAYFFEGDPRRYVREGVIRKIFGPDTSIISSYIIYEENSNGKTHSPSQVAPNPFGLKNMLGNVAEFCLDYYDPNVYGKYPAGLIKNPMGPRNGEAHSIRGGAYDQSARETRVSNRDFTRETEWLETDPQIPKSIWWYSDCKNVGFRVVCEYN